MRVAIFGGTFDPIHNGHVGMAQEVLCKKLVDRVWFLPARIPPHKLDKTITPTPLRLAMLQKCLPENAEICQHEIMKDADQTTSYSYQTMRELKDIYDHDFYFLFGMDSLNTLHLWREYEKFIAENEFIIYGRPGQTIPSFDDLKVNIADADLVTKLLNSIVELQDFHVSSTQVREAVHASQNITDLVPPAVAEIIASNQLYK